MSEETKRPEQEPSSDQRQAVETSFLTDSPSASDSTSDQTEARQETVANPQTTVEEQLVRESDAGRPGMPPVPPSLPPQSEQIPAEPEKKNQKTALIACLIVLAVAVIGWIVTAFIAVNNYQAAKEWEDYARQIEQDYRMNKTRDYRIHGSQNEIEEDWKDLLDNYTPDEIEDYLNDNLHHEDIDRMNKTRDYRIHGSQNEIEEDWKDLLDNYTPDEIEDYLNDNLHHEDIELHEWGMSEGASSSIFDDPREQADFYLQIAPFSRSSLIESLESDGFSEKEATQAVDSLKEDWKKQAVRFVEWMEEDGYSFSKEDLRDLCEEAGFTSEEIDYALVQTSSQSA